jgi:hypothetical protein
VIWRGLHPNAARVSFYNRFTQRETYAGPLNSYRIQPLEHLKDPLLVFGVNTDAIVAHSKYPISILLPSGDFDMRGSSWVPIFKCICQ